MNENRLFVGNYDNGIHLQVLNIDDAFVGTTSGELARKCIEVAPRAIHMLGESEAALLYEPLSEEYEAYFQALYGFRPHVFSLSDRYEDLSQPLSLLSSVLNDRELIEALSRHGRRYEWKLSPFIAHPLVFDLARATGLPVAGMQEQAVRQGCVIDLNDKALFQHACRRLNIPIPPSLHVKGWDALVYECARRVARDGKVFLRRSRAAGGLGNHEITVESMEKLGIKSMREYLEIVLKPHCEWTNETVLVEPVLDVVSSPGVLAHVVGDRVEIVGEIDQVLKDKAYIGGDFPSKESQTVCAQMIEWTKVYLRDQFIPLGGQGWVNIDFGRCNDGSLVAFESNARVTGSNHGIAVRQRLFNGDNEAIHTWTNDALKVPPGTTFRSVLDRLGSNVLWDAKRRDGIVITIPPGGNGEKLSMGYIALAQTDQRKLELRDAMSAFANQCWNQT